MTYIERPLNIHSFYSGLWNIPVDEYREAINQFLYGIETGNQKLILKLIAGNAVLSLSSEFTWLGKSAITKQLSSIFSKNQYRLSNFKIEQAVTTDKTVMVELTSNILTANYGASPVRFWIIYRFNNKCLITQAYFYSNLTSLL